MPQSLQSSELLLPLLAVGCICCFWTLSSWVKGLQLLTVLILFGGIVGARLGSTPLPIVFRDTVIVLPLYLAFFLTKTGRAAFATLPGDLILGLCAVVGWLVICLFNPAGASGLQLLIGLKVWAFYIPFVVVGCALAARPAALFKTLRTVLLCGLVACGVGLLQAMLIRVMGYQSAIGLFFGEAALAVTQHFASFDVGGGIYRIPSTFSFAAQYVEFLFLFLTVAVITSSSDPSPRFRKAGQIAFYAGFLAALFSGTKGAFLLFPLYAAAFVAFGLIRSRLLIVAPIAAVALLWAITAAGLDPLALVSFGAQQAESYGRGFIFQQIADATQYGMIGQGIGSSTGAARFATFGTDMVGRLGFESYYAKIAAELGTIGFVVFGVFFIGVAIRTSLIALQNRTGRANAVIAPLAIYVMLNLVYSFKGFVLDTDPGNIFFWLALGMMLAFDRQARSVQKDPDAVMVQDRLDQVPSEAAARDGPMVLR